MTRNAIFLLFCSVFLFMQIAVAQVVINEVCSFNGNLLQDEDHDEPDWIELYNTGIYPENLLNYSIKGDNPEPWIFPAVVIQPGQFLIIFASGKNKVSPNLHTHFKLSKQGETLILKDATALLIDELDVPALHFNHSFGRKTDSTTGITNAPTPGTDNITSIFYTSYVADPLFSIPAGLYNGSRTLEIAGAFNAVIRYTIDGSLPQVNSTIYSGSIPISSTTVVRAQAFSLSGTELYSDVVTQSYVMNYHQTLPVFSISTNPENLWDWNTGIYVSGPNASPNYPYYGANFWQDWEIPANIEFFETNGVRQVSQTVGVSINGGSSNRSKAMKSLRLTNKSKYGSKKFEYRFFEEKSINSFDMLVLRNSSGDFNKTHFRDGCLQKMMIGKLNIDLSCYRPSAVFLDGVYFGVHNIREKISKEYLSENYSIDKNNVDLLEEDSLVIEGDFATFNAFHTFVTGNNMADADNFSNAAKMIDTQSLCDYYIAETFLSNIDWPYNNLKLWRVREPNAKWRYILIDLDIALGNNGWAPASFDVLGRIMGTYGDANRHVQIFKSLLENKLFKQYFINRYADLVNTIFSTNEMTTYIEQTRSVLVEEMPLHFAKWGSDMAGWDHEIYQIAIPHISDRPAFAMEQVRAVFDLNKIVELELDVWPPQAGNIQINTITPGPLPWKGNYFDGNPITVTVLPNAGFEFVEWHAENSLPNSVSSPTLSFNPASSNKLIAYFSTGNSKDNLMVYPNPTKDKINFGCIVNHNEIGNAELLNAAGQKVLVLDNINLHTGVNQFNFDVVKLSAGVYMLKLQTSEGVKNAMIAIL
jgi:hypothetical protein